MTKQSSCPDCGAPLEPGAPGGACPGCLLAAGLDDTHTEGLPTRDELEAAFPALEIGRMLGRGGMGAVFAARQRKLDRQVALKVLPKQDPATARAFAERFEREARALARLDHPNIVRVYEFGESAGLHYLLMEYVDGVNLRDAMDDGRMTPQQALAVVPQICDALQYAHDQGVVHRDIKPENVLLSKEGAVKVADFGLAKLVTSSSAPDPTLTRAGQVMGTLHYMAPEQIESPTSVDHRADIYSLGVVFYELLTGDLPLGRFDPPSQRVRVDARLDEVVLRALEKKRERRFQKASEVRTAVDSISDAGDGAPVAPANAERAEAPAPRDRRARPVDDRPRWWEIEKELGIDWREYSLRAVASLALVPLVIVGAVTIGLGAYSSTKDVPRAFQWASLVVGLGLFTIVCFAVGGIAATARRKQRKGRWLAVVALLFALVAIPIATWATFWLVDVPGARREALMREAARRNEALGGTTIVGTAPNGWPIAADAVSFRDPDFELTHGVNRPIPASVGQRVKARLTYLFGVASRLSAKPGLDLDVATTILRNEDAQRLRGMEAKELAESAANGGYGLALADDDELPAPLADFRLVGAHADSDLIESLRHGTCKGTATAVAADWELVFRFESDASELVLSIDPVGWTRASSSVRARGAPAREEAVVRDWTGKVTARHPSVGDPYMQLRLGAQQLLRVLAAKATDPAFGAADARSLVAPSARERFVIPDTRIDPTGVASNDAGLPALLVALPESRSGRAARIREDLPLLVIVEYHVDRDEQHARVVARSSRNELTFRVALEGEEWWFDVATAEVRPLSGTRGGDDAPGEER